MSFRKFTLPIVILIAVIAALMLVFADPAGAGHNRDRIVVKKYVPARSSTVVPTPHCTERIYFTSRGRHVRAGITIRASLREVVVVNRRSRGVTARVAC